MLLSALALALAALTLALAPGALASFSGHSRPRAHARTHRRHSCARAGSYRASGKHARSRRRRAPARCAPAKHRRSQPTHRRSKPTHKRAHPHAQTHRTQRTSAADACANSGLTPNEADLALIREAMLCLVNRERALHGEAQLTVSAQLLTAAQAHTESMVEGSYFEHVGPSGDTPLARMRAAGYPAGSTAAFEVGENIAWGSLWLGSPRAIFDGWMNSPAHRANILDTRFRETAIGVSPRLPRSWAHGQGGAIYTQDFGVIEHH